MCDSQFKMLEFVSSWSNWAWEIQLGQAVRMQDAGVSGAGINYTAVYSRQNWINFHLTEIFAITDFNRYLD